MTKIESYLRKLIKEERSKLFEQVDIETLALNLLDSVEGDLNDTPGIDTFFRKNGIVDKNIKRKILNYAAKAQK